MMLLNSCSDRQSEQPCGIGAEAGRPVENSKPSEVVGEVFRVDADAKLTQELILTDPAPEVRPAAKRVLDQKK